MATPISSSNKRMRNTANNSSRICNMNICGGGPRSLIIPALMILCAPTKMHQITIIESFSPSYSSSSGINNGGQYCNAFIVDRHNNNQLQSLSPHVTHALYYTPPSLSASSTMQLFSTSSSTDINNNEEKSVIKTNTPTTKAATTDIDFTSGIDTIFTSIDIDNSGTIDLDEYNLALSSTQYTNEEIVSSFREIDEDGNGEISREEFYNAITNLQLKQQAQQAQRNDNNNDDNNNNDNDDTIIIIEDPCPMGYWLNSITQQCQPLSPLGTFSQRIETSRALKPIYNRLVNLKPNRDAIRKSGVSFALAYSIISNLNGAISLSIAWYMTVKRTGLSPLYPGQKRQLFTSYAMIYGALQLLKPFRVAAAIAMSKLSSEYLEMTQERFNCSRNVAIGCQYMMGQFMMGATFFVGVSIVSLVTGVDPGWSGLLKMLG